jgi:hypothetical protein
MRIFCLLMALAVAGLTYLGGCDGDDGGEGTVLAQGTITIPASDGVEITTVHISEPGTLQGRIVWSGAPSEVWAAFRHVATSNVHGLSQSPSPLFSTVAVTSADVAAGTDWLFLAENPGAAAVSVEYEIRFLAD